MCVCGCGCVCVGGGAWCVCMCVCVRAFPFMKIMDSILFSIKISGERDSFET